MSPRLLSRSCAWLAVLSAVAPAWSLGFGAIRASATIGHPLDVSVPLRLQPGEALPDSCVGATVHSGDVPVPSSQVTAQLVVPTNGGEPRIRVRTSSRIDEPFVTVAVHVGCESRLSRQFTVFADPPGVAPTLEPLPATAQGPALPAAREGAREARREVPAVAAARRATPVARARPPAPVRTAKAAPRVVKPPRERLAVEPIEPARASLAARPPMVDTPPAPTPAEAERLAQAPLVPVTGVARLRLDAPVVTVAADQASAEGARQREEAALATAKIAVDVATAANRSADQRVAAMESTLAQLRKEAADQKATIERLRGTKAEDSLWASWGPWLAAACAGLFALAAVFYLRMRRLDTERMRAWLQDNDYGPPTRQTDFDTVAPATEFPFEEPPPARRAGPPSRPASAPIPLEPAAAPTMPVPLTAATASRFVETTPSSAVELDDPTPAHDVTIEELLDVEQQAEFFIVLGQDDAAIEMLVTHVMSSGGASPMPYLKLLEIYRRLGDQTAYERTRKRFNARFNGVAPDWSIDPNAGRSLDDYPEVIGRIVGAWTRPVDAMAELQTLMFRNDRSHLFDLPAYRDILLLFTVARDLHEATAQGQAPVDVLLPLRDDAMRMPERTPAPGASGTGAGAPAVDSRFGALARGLSLEDTPPTRSSTGRR